MTLEETICSECEKKPRDTFGDVRDELDSYCGKCGAGPNPWELQPAYEFDDNDLPIVFSYESYDDTYGLWDAFCRQYFGDRVKGSDVADLPDGFPTMKYCVVELWFVVTNDYELEGPFRTKSDAKGAVT